MRLGLFVILCITFSLSAIANEKILCLINSDIDSDIAKIVVDMDLDNRVIKHFYQDTFHGDVLTERLEIIPSDLTEGVVLKQKDKNIIIRIQSDNYDSERGALINLDTLYNGINGQRKLYEMDLVMDNNGPVFMNNKVNFTTMKFIAKRSKVLGVIGIEKVLFGN